MISRGCLPYDLSHASRGLGEKLLLAETGSRTKPRCPPQWLLAHGQQTRTDYWGLLGKGGLLRSSSCLKAGHQSLSARVEAHEPFGSGFWPHNLTFLGLLRCLNLPRFRAGCSSTCTEPESSRAFLAHFISPSCPVPLILLALDTVPRPQSCPTAPPTWTPTDSPPHARPAGVDRLKGPCGPF